MCVEDFNSASVSELDGRISVIGGQAMPPDVALWLAEKLISTARASILRNQSELILEAQKASAAS